MKPVIATERLIFHNAFVLPNNTAQFDIVPPEVAQGMTAMAEASPDKSVPLIEDFVRGDLMAGESADMQDALLAKLSPQPLVIFTTKVDTEPFDRLDIPKTYHERPGDDQEKLTVFSVNGIVAGGGPFLNLPFSYRILLKYKT